MEKIKVFISSKLSDDFPAIRKSISDKLIDIGWFEVYDFDLEGASSTNLVNSYNRKVDTHDIILVLIDNKTGVNPGVQNEIDRAKQKNKRILYLFSSEGSSVKTDVQISLEQESIESVPRFVNVSRNIDLIDKAVQSVFGDVINEYIERKETESKNTPEKSLMVESYDYRISRSTIKDFDFLTELLFSYLDIGIKYKPKDSSLNTTQIDAAKNLLNIVLGETTYTSESIENINDVILEHHDENFHDIIQKRIQALNSYLLSDYSGTIHYLKEAIEICDSNDVIPNWFKLDVAVDLRNTLFEFNRRKSLISIENDGQKIIEKSTEPLYYPYLDREKSTIYKEISSRYDKINKESPYTNSFRNNDYLITSISNTFTISMLNVSITNMHLIRSNIIDFIKILNYEHKSNLSYLTFIKMLILERDEKELATILRRYNFDKTIITKDDIENITDMIENENDKQKILMMKCIFIKNFGYYIDDENYKYLSNYVIKEIKKWIRDNDKTVSIGQLLVTTLSENILRLNQETLVNLLLDFIENNFRRWEDEVFKALSYIDYSAVDSQVHKRIQEIIINMEIIDPNLVKNSIGYQNFLMQYFHSSKIDLKYLTQYFIKNYNNFYINNIEINQIGLSLRQTEDYIEIELSKIKSRNEEQGKNGTTFGYGKSPYIEIGRIIARTDNVISEDMKEQLIESVKESLTLSTQTIDFKIDCLVFIMSVNKKLNFNNEYLKLFLLDNKEIIQDNSGSSFFTNDSVRLLDFVFSLTLSNLSNDDLILLDNLFFTMEFDNYETIQSLKYLSTYLRFIDKITLDVTLFKYILHFSALNTTAEEKNIRIFAANCLIELVKFEPETVSEKLYFIYEESTIEIKSHILYRLRQKDINNVEYIDKIFTSANIDDNFLVQHSLNGQ